MEIKNRQTVGNGGQGPQRTVVLEKEVEEEEKEEK
jgi:hypothetical protein